MKKLLQLGMLCMAVLAFSHTAFGQKKLKEGFVRFELEMDEDSSPEMAMMGGTTLEFYFNSKHQKMDMNMMGGMMRIQTIIPNDKPADGTILMDMMGQKIQIVDLNEDEISESNNFMNVDNIAEITYDEKDKKEIAGYSCYKAKVNSKDGMEMIYYITEKIQPPTPVKQSNTVQLKGYPLQMNIDTGQGFIMKFVASEVSGEIDEKAFTVPEGYQKMTMEEFEKEMGDMGGFGN